VATRTLRLVLLVSLVAALAAPSAMTNTGQSHVALTSLESGVLVQLNRIRAQHGLAPLRLNNSLTAAAAQHTREMAADGYFSHDSVNGTAFWRRIQRWYGQGNYSSWSVGENLLWSSPGVDPAGALQLWMHSPEHRANILDPQWREIGVAAVHVGSAPGEFGNAPVTIVTTDFGARG
jgi:uncharacterized protein YkwD